VEQHRRAVAGKTRPDRARILARARVGEATLLDTRPAQEYAAAHLAGALHAPPAELDSLAPRLADDRLVVTYGRGPHSPTARDMARRLRDLGFDATHLDLGVPELRRLGFPVETSPGGRAPL
jgi:ArsR family transcriptional regulator